MERGICGSTSWPVRSPSGMEAPSYNASFLIGPDGAVIGRHRKIHLFNVSLEDVKVKESAVLSPGDAPLVAELPFCRLGVAICYDVRFPEVFRFFGVVPGRRDRASRRVLAHHGGGALALAPPFARGRLPGLRRRRLPGAARWREVRDVRPLPRGRSWGTILREAGEGSETVIARLDAKLLERVRRELPVLVHRRPDLYDRWRAARKDQ